MENLPSVAKFLNLERPLVGKEKIFFRLRNDTVGESGLVWDKVSLCRPG